MELGAAMELSTIALPSAFLPLSCVANLAKNLAGVSLAIGCRNLLVMLKGAPTPMPIPVQDKLELCFLHLQDDDYDRILACH